MICQMLNRYFTLHYFLKIYCFNSCLSYLFTSLGPFMALTFALPHPPPPPPPSPFPIALFTTPIIFSYAAHPALIQHFFMVTSTPVSIMPQRLGHHHLPWVGGGGGGWDHWWNLMTQIASHLYPSMQPTHYGI
jgi:hypothetical protein